MKESDQMAQKVLVQLVDDLDGDSSQEVSTVLFGLDGVSYEIDLSDTNAECLRESLQEFVDSARRTGGRTTRPAQSGKSAGSGEAGQIREWALENGFGLAGRGRIPSHVVEAYKEAQAEPKTRTKAASKRRARTKKS
jgi:Lsr2